jgi:hypothetical protein
VLRIFLKWRRQVLIARLSKHLKLEHGAVEYANADYSLGVCRSEPLHVVRKQGDRFINEPKPANSWGLPQFHLDVLRNRILVVDVRPLSGSAYAVYPLRGKSVYWKS